MTDPPSTSFEDTNPTAKESIETVTPLLGKSGVPKIMDKIMKMILFGGMASVIGDILFRDLGLPLALQTYYRPKNTYAQCTLDEVARLEPNEQIFSNKTGICEKAEHKPPSLSIFDGLDRNIKYLIVNTRGGLGNRLGAMGSAYGVARVTGRVLVEDWPIGQGGFGDLMEMPGKFNDLFANHILSIDQLLADDNGCITQDARINLLNFLTTGNLFYGGFFYNGGFFHNVERMSRPKDTPAEITERILNSDVEVIYLSNIVRDFIGLFLDTSNVETATKNAILKYFLEFLTVLKPTQFVHQEVEKYANKYFSQPNHHESVQIVGIHYRSFSKGVGDEHFALKSSGLLSGLFNEFVDRMNAVVDENKLKNLTTKFFVATDDVEVVDKLKNRVEAEILNYNHEKHGVSRHDLPSQLGGLIDFFLLARTHKVMGVSQSTFSDMAALLTGERVKENIGPDIFGDPAVYSTLTTSNYYLSWLNETGQVHMTRSSRGRERISTL